MKHAITSGVAICFALLATVSATAQDLSTDSEAQALCNYSEPQGGEGAGERESERRKLLHRRFSVTVGASTAPVIGYDELSGVLALNAYRPLTISNGHALVLDGAGAIPFDVSPERAHEIIARYNTDQARLRIEFVPAPFADSEQPICTSAGQKAAKKTAEQKENAETAQATKPTAAAEPTDTTPVSNIHGALLKASIVDQLGRPIATFETSLGREIELMKSHNIAGFLASAYPQVTVSSISFFDGKPSYPKTSPRVPPALDRSLRTQIQKRLYGCYVRGLATNARLQGALVVQFEARADANATVMVDSLNAPPVVGCVVERLGQIGVLHADRVDGHTSLKATLIFRLKDNSL